MKVAEKEAKTIETKEQKKEEKVKKERDYSIDLIRVVACLSVICAHLSLQVLNTAYNRIDWSRLLEKSFLKDGIALFFMITGFFLVNGRSYKKIWSGTIKKILLPSFIFVLFTQAFYPFIVNKESFLYCLQNFNINPIQIVQSILKGDITYLNDLCAHLWYIYSYVKVVIWIPILWLVCKETNECKLARKIMLGFGIASLLLQDIQRFFVLPVIGEIKLLTIVPTEIVYVLLGYELFVRKDKLKNNKKLTIISLIGFVATNLIKYRVEIFYMVANNLVDIVGRPNFIEWEYTAFNVVSGLCWFIFLYSIDLKNEKFKKALLWLSNKTFGIYLVHYLILAKVDLYKFEKIEKFVLELLYLFVGMIVTLILSLIILVIIEQIKKIFSKGIKLVFNKKEES